jgi:pilus assembly protein CpaE
VQIFDLLIDDIEAELGEAWGDLSFLEAQTFLNQPDAETLEFVAIAIDDEDEPEIELVCSIIRLAKSKDIKVMLIAEDVSPAALHKLLQSGTDDFVPYPLPERAFHDSLARIRSNTPAPAEIGDHVSEGAESIQPTTTDIKDHVLFAVQSMAGGTGATTLAVNLAWELANIDKKLSPSVCLLDLDLQFGSTSTYLDLPRREVIYEVLSDAQTMDVDAFKQALLSFNQRLSVFTAPSDILPLDIIGQEEVKALLRLARETFDVVVVDMPSTIVSWSETVMNEADVYFATLELDMRSAQNTMRFIKALQAEGLPTDKLHYVLNRAPRNLDLSGKGRVKRLAESLDIELKTQLPDGTKQVSQACDHGVPLADMARKNPLRKEILKLAKTLHEAIAVQAVAR